jgi:hypothetical protein
MATDVETRTGTCPTHGRVEATREIPRAGFPWLVNAVRRSLAKRRPYKCPTCGQPVSTG